jgi:ADP-ribosylglycohydrolase
MTVDRGRAGAPLPEEMGRLALILATYFQEGPRVSQGLVKDAGLDDAAMRVDFTEPPASLWWNVLLQLRDRAEVEALLARGLEVLPGQPELAAALDRVRGSSPAPHATPESRPGPTASFEHDLGAGSLQRVGAPGLEDLGPPARRPLIDRSQAVELLHDLLARAKRERAGGTLLILGDSGVGKTRLVQEAVRLSAELGMGAMVGHCIDQHAEPLLPLRDALSRYRGWTPVPELLAAGPQGLSDFVPFLESFLGVAPGRVASSPLGGSGSQGVYEGLAQVVVGLAEAAGLCLVVEDVTDADRDTLSFLGYLGRKAAASRLLFVVTIREDLLEPELSSCLDGWRAGGWSSLAVPAFARADAVRFIAMLRDGEPMQEGPADEVLALTGGNALFIEQVLGLVVEGGGKQTDFTEVPARIDAVLRRRLRHLDGELRAFLDAASVAFDVSHDFDLLADLSGLDEDATRDHLDEAVRRRLLRVDAQGTVGFTQKLLQRVLLEGLAPSRSRALDLRAAEWLEGAGLLASASHHYGRAGRTADMVRTALGGAEQAEHAGMYATAVQLYLRARPAGDAQPIDVRLARDHLVLGAWSEAEAILDRLPEDLGEARIVRSDLHFVRGAFNRALRELRLASQDPTVNRTEALIRLADIHLYLGRLRTAMELGQEALENATDGTERAACLAVVGTSRYHMGDVVGAEDAYLKQLAALPKEAGDRHLLPYTVALHNLGLAQEARGDWEAAKRFHAEALQLRREVSAAREVGHSRHSLIRCEIGLGSFEAARAQLAEARKAAVALGEHLEEGKLDHTEAHIELLTGGSAERAVRLVEGARERFGNLGAAYDVAHASFSLACAYERTGADRRSLEEAAEARAQMQRGEFGLLALHFPDRAYTYPDRVTAGLLGYALGDAVGLPWERRPPQEIDATRLTPLRATEEWPAGSTSDDTALTLLVAEELTANLGGSAVSFLQRLATAAPGIRGLGPSTTAAIDCFRRTGGSPTAGGNTNGALMRSLPVGWAVPVDRVDERRAWTVELSCATHPGPEAVTAACVGAACATWAIEGATPAMLLRIAREEAAAAVTARSADPRIVEMLAAVANGAWRPDYEADLLDPYETVTRALWCVVTQRTLADALLAAVRLGGDTDTVAALVGGLLGCRLPAADVRNVFWADQVRMPPEHDLARLSDGLAGIRVRTRDG